jgi:hypothetical protein
VTEGVAWLKEFVAVGAFDFVHGFLMFVYNTTKMKINELSNLVNV